MHLVTQKHCIQCPQLSHMNSPPYGICVPSAVPGDMMLSHRVLPSGSLPTVSPQPSMGLVSLPSGHGHGVALPGSRANVKKRLLTCYASRGEQSFSVLSLPQVAVVSNSFQTQDDGGVPQEWPQQSPGKADSPGSWPCSAKGGQAWDKPEVGALD